MWRWLWTPSLLLSLAMLLKLQATPSITLAQADSARPIGPTSSAEAALLWKDGKAAFEQGHYDEAISRLQRLVDRYPGIRDYLEAERLLGRSYSQTGAPAQALPYLRDSIRSAGSAGARGIEGLRTRLWLGDAELALSHFHEAYLTAIEIESKKKIAPKEVFADALLLKARALLGLKEDVRATRALDSAKQDPITQQDPRLRGRAAWVELEIKLQDCAKLPSARHLSEDQVLDQLGRRSNCLLESLPIYKKAMIAGEVEAATAATHELNHGFARYHDACRNPPEPLAARKEGTSAQELKRYRDELAGVLHQQCSKTGTDAVQLMSGWKDALLPAIAPLLQETEKGVLCP